MDLPQVEIGRIQVTDPPRIIWIRVQDAIGLLWGNNPKEHDVGSIITSIDRYGFQELPKYDATLGGIKAGNGRTYCLGEMEKVGYPVPRGIGVVDDGDRKTWVMPLMVGTDAESDVVAKAYAIDANNLTMAGGSLTPFDMMKVWNSSQYMDILREIYQDGGAVVSVDGDDLDALQSLLNMEAGDYGNEINIDPDQIGRIKDSLFRVRVKDLGTFRDIVKAVKELIQDHGWDAEITL